ncbi:nucleotidyltransferase family protein [Candidimonas sp. SYP-B2681]|uniref:N-acetylmuramate alpha-1-phosphate uridylyltransferase MurU n=1 Tax=Candidimonas sp. SYP-B2681 TaxID=2497686 RepID=UPI000F882F9B|nr:nucleotidyltransferase family protein [Candidimonas sp. SYP-B2681]RTZ44740.1 nucleotidyltransferase family protein [Candidimonas sp. SYP-B2681]
MQAMILAAGRGERMRPLTDSIPKPLLEAGGRPLIVWHIERLVKAGITELIINHAWLGEQIEQMLGNGSQYGAHITYSREVRPLETAGGIAKALPFFRGEPFLVINADIWCDWNPAQAMSIAANLAESMAWLLLVDNPPQHSQGDFQLNGCGLVADKALDTSPATLTFSGIGIYSPKLFEGIADNQAAPLAPLLRRAINRQKVRGTHYTGRWVDVGTPQRLADLNRALSA